ncbi:MAG: type IV pilus modification PilV family protein [Rubrivivax sp.]
MISRAQAGTSLLEALVALACVCTGAVALSRQHTELRQVAEASRQRAEALRLAQATLESARTAVRRASLESGAAAAPPGGTPGGTPSDPATVPASAPATSSASACEVGSACTLELTSQDAWQPPRRAVRVVVAWRDRAGTPRQLELASIFPAPGGSPPAPAPAAPP